MTSTRARRGARITPPAHSPSTASGTARSAMSARPAPEGRGTVPAPADASAADRADHIVGQLMGYHARRASLVLVDGFTQAMQASADGSPGSATTQATLRPVEFSVLCVIAAQPGITAREVCAVLSLLPPNLVNLLARLEQQGWIDRQPHPKDRRATGLFATNSGITLSQHALQTALAAERQRLAALSETEQQTLMQLLQKVYR